MLSELDMMNLWAKQLRGYASQWERLFGFGYAIEAEVSKQDDALIRQLVEALEAMQSEAAARSCGLRKCDEAIALARARLEQPCA